MVVGLLVLSLMILWFGSLIFLVWICFGFGFCLTVSLVG